MAFNFNETNEYTIGNEIIQLTKQVFRHKVSRVLIGDSKPNTNIKLKALDNIHLSLDEPIFYGKNTSRTFASLHIEPSITTDQQQQLVQQFNEFIETNRLNYHSLWLSNYREGKRKRIPFGLAYVIISYLLE